MCGAAAFACAFVISWRQGEQAGDGPLCRHIDPYSPMRAGSRQKGGAQCKRRAHASAGGHKGPAVPLMYEAIHPLHSASRGSLSELS